MHDHEKTILMPAKIKIDVDSIPEYQKNQLVEWALDLTRYVFSQPGEESRYQAWLQKRKEALNQPVNKGAAEPERLSTGRGTFIISHRRNAEARELRAVATGIKSVPVCGSWFHY